MSVPPHKVLLVGPYPPPYGGLSVQLQQWQQHLRTTCNWSCEVLNIGERRTESLPGAYPVRSYVDFWRKLTNHARHGYLIHLFTNGHNFKSWLSALACASAGCFNHRRSLLVFGSGDLPKFIQKSGPLARAITKAAVRLSGHIVCRNEEMRDALSNLGIDRSKISIVPGYYGTVLDHSADIPSGIQKFISEHWPVVGAIATLAPEYGAALLLESVPRLQQQYPKLGIVIIGIGGGEKSRLPIAEQGHVCLAGPFPNPIALAVMSRLTVFVRPTLFDGDSVSVREALSLGIPVVASNTGYRPPGVKLFKRGDVVEMTAAIREVIEERDCPAPQLHASSAVDSVNQLLLLYNKILAAE